MANPCYYSADKDTINWLILLEETALDKQNEVAIKKSVTLTHRELVPKYKVSKSLKKLSFGITVCRPIYIV